MANLSPYNIDKIVFILLTFLKAFPPVWGMHNLLPSTVICFSFRFGCTDCSLYTKNLFDWEFIYFSLWTNYYFVIESINVFYFVNNGVCVCVCVCGRGRGRRGIKIRCETVQKRTTWEQSFAQLQLLQNMRVTLTE